MTAQVEVINNQEDTQSQDPQAVVEAFFNACSTLDFDAAMEFIDDHCVYKNMPFHTAKGKNRIQRDLSLMAKGMNQFAVDIINIAVNGNVVLTERIDTLGGRFFKIDIPLMGVLVVNNGKITEWRDYFDWSHTMGKLSKSALLRPFKAD